MKLFSLSALHRKLLRDLRRTTGQVLAIALVIAAGVSTFILSTSTLDSLSATRTAYYQDYHFADIFATAKRAPNRLQQRIEAIPGVDKVQTRVVATVKLVIAGFNDPVKGQIVSLPETGQPLLNQLYLREGRLIDPDSDHEILVNGAFADAHGFKPGDKLDAIIKGRLKNLTIVGVALSPEFVYQIAPGAIMPDFKRYGVLWMSRRLLASSFDMDGAFNSVVLSVSNTASVQDTLDQLDLLLRPYGGIDSYGREWQVSHRFLNEEFKQLRQMSVMFSTIFLGVAAFLLNIVVKRLIDTQREQIAALKAFGYRNREIGQHYIAYVLAIVALGLLLGTAAGVWLGKALSLLYMDYYRFPFLDYQLHPDRIAVVTLVTVIAAVLGTLFSVRAAVKLAPAEAMRPEPPAVYRESVIERLGIKKYLPQSGRMIVRNIERKPVKALLSILGVAFASAIMVVGTFFNDSIDYMVDIEYGLSQRQDATVTFIEPTSYRALFDLLHIPGVEYGEAFRSVPVRLRYQHHSYRTAIQGYPAQRRLYKLLDEKLNAITLPESGLAITDQLAKMLQVSVGDTLTVEVLEGRRPILQVPVTALVKQYIGVAAYMRLPGLNQWLGEGDTISGAYLKINPQQQQQAYTELKDVPQVANTDVRVNVIHNFNETVAEFMLVYVVFISVLSGIITFGVIYNTARIALSERSRELASMRVLGFTRGEIAMILLGELGLLTLLAIPLGLWIGFGLCSYMVSAFQLELFRIPLIIETHTYAFAVFIVLLAALLSGLLVRIRLDHLNLIAVLKTRE